VDCKHCGFDVTLLRRHGGGEIAVQADHRADVGAGARKFQHITAAKAETDRDLARGIADAALVGLSH
jgi:hypothetical protein